MKRRTTRTKLQPSAAHDVWKPIYMPTRAETSAFEREFGKRARFLFVESLGPGTAEALRTAGWNVKYVDDVGLNGRSDEDVLAFAKREDLILLTHDTDFLDDRRFPPHRNPGVVVLPGGSGGEQVLLRALGQMLSVVGMYREIWRFSKVIVETNGELVVVLRDYDSGAMTRERYRFPRVGPPLILQESDSRRDR